MTRFLCASRPKSRTHSAQFRVANAVPVRRTLAKTPVEIAAHSGEKESF